MVGRITDWLREWGFVAALVAFCSYMSINVEVMKDRLSTWKDTSQTATTLTNTRLESIERSLKEAQDEAKEMLRIESVVKRMVRTDSLR